MNHVYRGILVLLLGLSPLAAGDDSPSKPATLAEQNQAIAKEFNSEGFALRQAETDEEREKIAARVKLLALRLLDLAEKNPQDPAAIDALVQVVTHEMWMENNTPHAGWGPDSPESRAIAILLRDFVESDKAAEACRRLAYGFREECETFLRKVAETNGFVAAGPVPELPIAKARTAR
jgi:hypothetical protein